MTQKDYEALYNENKCLVSYVVHKISSFTTRVKFIQEEVNAAGFNGLSKACYLFNPSHNVKFCSFAVPVIYREILHYLKTLKAFNKHEHISLNRIIDFGEEERTNEEIIYYLQDDVQKRRDERYAQIEDAAEVLAALVTCANPKDQEIYISKEIDGKSFASIGKSFNMTFQGIDCRIRRVKRKMTQVLSFMRARKDVPNMYQYASATEWRKAYALYFLKHKHKELLWRDTNKERAESPLINKYFTSPLSGDLYGR